MNTSEEKVLEDIRRNFTYATDAWRDIREEAKKDMQYVAGDPWDPAERARREDPKHPRPSLALDELSQYTNQLINDVRDQKRSVQVVPTGPGSDDKSAELRGNIIRQIEYESEAQAAYITAFENAVNRSYGAFRIGTAYISPDSFLQKITIKRIANPDTVFPDPDFREADASDMAFCFVTDTMEKNKFLKEYPDAEVRNFSVEMQTAYPVWIRPDKIQIAEYWEKKMQKFELAMLENGKAYDSEEVPRGSRVVRTRVSERPSVTQYITNGVEILEKHSWLGKLIPIVMVFGKELWIDDGSGAKRILMSLVRLARDPYMLYCYYRSTEAELIRMTPKTPFVGVKGQFENAEEFWQQVNDTPYAYLEYKAITEATGPNVLGPPQRPAYDPPIQSLEVGAESARRAIQSAMGIMPLPTPAQRQNEKSGIAIERIQTQTQKGSFHFLDNYERSLRNAGRIINDLIDKVYDTEREVAIRRNDETHAMVGINPDLLGTGEHSVTISTGPSFESERDQANQFVDSLFANIPALPISDSQKAQLIALAIKMKDLGPIAEQMVEIISPQQDSQLSPQATAALQKAQSESQQLHAYAQALEQELQKLSAEKQAKVVDNEYRMTIEKMKIEAQLAIAEIETKSQILNERLRAVEDIYAQLHSQAHEVALQAQTEANQRSAQEQNQDSTQDQNPAPVGSVTG